MKWLLDKYMRWVMRRITRHIERHAQLMGEVADTLEQLEIYLLEKKLGDSE